MKKPKFLGRRTEYSRPIESKGELIVPNRELTVVPEVPVSISLTENADASALGVVARFANRKSIWFDAEVIHAKAAAAGLVDAFLEGGKVICSLAIGYAAGKVIVELAA